MAKEKKVAVTVETTTAEGVTTAPPVEAAKVEEPKVKKRGKIEQILEHFKNGKTTKEIAQLTDVEDGELFHPTTISIQVNKFRKANPDIYPPKLPAETKAAKKAREKAEKEAAKANDDGQPKTETAEVVEAIVE